MKGQIKSRFTPILIILIIVFGAMFIMLNGLAISERAHIQEQLMASQQRIMSQISSDYETEIRLIDEMTIQDDYNIQKIKYEILDQLMMGLSEEEALEQIRAFNSKSVNPLNVYSDKNWQLIESIGDSDVYIATTILEMLDSINEDDIYKVAVNPIQERISSKDKSHLYLYRPKSQPWVLVTRILHKSKENDDFVSQLTQNEFSKKPMSFEGMVVNREMKVTRSYSNEMEGGIISSVKPYRHVLANRKGGSLYSFELLQKNNIKETWVGTITKTESGQIVVATLKRNYEKAFYDLTMIIFFIIAVGIIFSFAVSLLIHRNYLYFLEGEQMGGRSQ